VNWGRVQSPVSLVLKTPCLSLLFLQPLHLNQCHSMITQRSDAIFLVLIALCMQAQGFLQPQCTRSSLLQCRASPATAPCENGAERCAENVFYNEIQRINRDLSILMATLLVQQRQLESSHAADAHTVVLDGLTASGIRAIRCAQGVCVRFCVMLGSFDASKL
jgi:N2,N2-dimethylguanosine tRNA methyltransferase